jgi:membrane-bound serine protease (ClpP class)
MAVIASNAGSPVPHARRTGTPARRVSWPRVVVLLLLALALLALPTLVSTAPDADRRALLLEVRGGIGPAISDFVERGIARAGHEGAAGVVLRLDTPGGLDTSMRAMIKAVIASPVPVVVYVAPGGARAASAGTFLLYAAHAAAMAPGTNLGAATPVSIGPGAVPASDPPREDEKRGEDAAPDSSASAMRRKVVNDAVAYIRSLAELRGRNADWAEKAVREGASLSAERALEEKVIDLLARDLDDLLEQLDGREVTVAGATQILDTRRWMIEEVTPDWRTELLAVITNPNVAYILLLIGIYGLMFEVYSPGAVIPGIAGVISLLLALYALHLLPVNYAGVALLLVGVALMAMELFTPSFGALGVGGVVAFVAGSVMLFDEDVDGVALSLPLAITVSLCFSGLMLATAVLLARMRRHPVVTGREEMMGATGCALEAFSDTGRVRVHGEVWNARARAPVARDQTVRVCEMDGLVLEVEPDTAAPTTNESRQC